MDYFWIIVRGIEDLAVGLLLFALLTACVVRWRRKPLSVGVQAGFILLIVAWVVFAISIGREVFIAGPHFTTMKYLLIGASVIHVAGYIAIACFGWRRREADALPAAATWPRSRLLLAFLVALVLDVVTCWNVTLAVQQRLARAEVEARVLMLSAMPGRPIDSLNAAILYEPVFERLPEHNHEHKVVQDDWLDFDTPLDVDAPGLRELLANRRGDLDALIQASTRAQCYFGIHQPSDFLDGEDSYDWFGPMHVAGRLLAVDTRTRIAEGDLENAVRNTSAMFRLARHTDQSPALIAALIGRAIDRWAIGCLQDLLNHPDLSAEVLNGLQLEPRTDYRRILRRASIFEEGSWTTFAKRISAEGFRFIEALTDGDADQQSGTDPLRGFLWTVISPYVIEHELEVLRSLHREYRALLGQSWPAESARSQQFDERRGGGILSAMVFPILESVTPRMKIVDARHRQARLAIAMRRYELENGEFPGDFENLAPIYLEEVLLDPSTGEPFKIEKVDGGVTLYSEGVEAMDHREGPDEEQVVVEMFLKSRSVAE